MNNPIGAALIPLQSYQLNEFWKPKSSDNHDAMLFVVGIGIVVMILIILNIVKNKFKPKPGEHHISSAGPRNFSSFTLHRLTSGMELDREQLKMLEYVLRSGGINDPARFLASPALIDRHFKRAYRLIERTSSSEEDLNTRLSTLFSTRNVLDSKAGGNSQVTTTRQIPEKTAGVLTIDKINYPVHVVSSRGPALTVENPTRSAGSPVHFSKGSKAKLAFFTKSSKGFAIETRVLGAEETQRGPVLQLAHSDQIKKLSNRRHRRRQKIISTAYFIVYEENKKMRVDKRRHTGNIQDISVGGCSIKTNLPINNGQKIKIEFTHDDDSVVAALGEVLRTERAGVNTVMHIRFLKVPRKSLNSINAMVYEYADS